MKTKLFLFSLLGIFALLLAQLFKYTHDFRVDYISRPITYHPAWEVQHMPSSKEIRPILKQPFYYLGKGGQAYAFESEDGQYVLKFVKFKFLEPRFKHLLLSYVPFFEDWNANEMERRYRKFHDFYLGYKWAYEVNKENSGLVYLHFNPTFSEFGSATLFDRKGLKHSVDLDQTVFIIQKKSIMLNELLVQLLESGELKTAKQKVDKVLEMYVAHYKMGLHDLGYGVIHNTGFADDLPIHVDLGKMTWDTEIMNQEIYHADLTIIADKIKEWVKKNYPHYSQEFETSIEKKMTSFFEPIAS